MADDSITQSLSDYDGSISSRNEARRTLGLLKDALNKQTVKVWTLGGTIASTLGRTVERLMDSAESNGDIKTALLAAEVLRKLNADNAKILATVDKLVLAEQANEKPDPSKTPQTVIIVKEAASVNVVVKQ